jgi:hypothetical protein
MRLLPRWDRRAGQIDNQDLALGRFLHEILAAQARFRLIAGFEQQVFR